MTQNQPNPIAPEASSDFRFLSQLLPGMSATVVQLQAKGAIRQRLLEMGFIRGATLKVEKLAPLGDPMELVLKGYHLSLRRDEGACILVQPVAQPLG
ncbi:MAG: ferrous iron transport protein A [Holophagaceae bacterium]|nr:ferrous iron transport protein A [Holophagaceae bacterium]